MWIINVWLVRFRYSAWFIMPCNIFCNLFYVLFEIESTDTRTVHPDNEQFKNSRTYHPTISNECCVDEDNTDNI